MKTTMKIISVLMVALMMIMVATPVLATSRPSDVKFDESNTDKISDMGASILGIIRVVGTIVAVGALVVLGIKYMMGSVEEKAEYKKSFIPYIIGAVLLFAAVNLADYIYSWASGV